MLDTMCFYEFIPVNLALEPQNAVPLEEVVLGKDYRMIITTCSDCGDIAPKARLFALSPRSPTNSYYATTEHL
jgi:hypothetical protein